MAILGKVAQVSSATASVMANQIGAVRAAHDKEPRDGSKAPLPVFQYQRIESWEVVGRLGDFTSLEPCREIGLREMWFMQ